MDENLKKQLLAKYPDDSEGVKSLYAIIKDKQQTRSLIERIYECMNEKELVSRVLVDMYVGGRMREQLNRATFIQMLSKFNEKDFNVRSVQRYIRKTFDSKEVIESRRKAEEQRSVDYIKRRSNSGKDNYVALIIQKVSDLQFDALLRLVSSMGVEIVKMGVGEDSTNPFRNVLGMNIHHHSTTLSQGKDDSQQERYRIICKASTLLNLLPKMRSFYGDKEPSVSYYSQCYHNENISIDVAQYLAGNDAKNERK